MPAKLQRRLIVFVILLALIAGALLASAVCGLSLALSQRQEVLPALPARLWWIILPACLAVLGGMATWQLSTALLRYAY